MGARPSVRLVPAPWAVGSIPHYRHEHQRAGSVKNCLDVVVLGQPAPLESASRESEHQRSSLLFVDNFVLHHHTWWWQRRLHIEGDMQRRLWPWIHVHWWSCPSNWLAYVHPSVEPQSFDWCVTCCYGTLVASNGLDLPTTSVLHPREWSGARARIWSPVCDHSLEYAEKCHAAYALSLRPRSCTTCSGSRLGTHTRHIQRPMLVR